MESKTIQILPKALSLIESMRSIGYSFATALADIIDNSISANATKIDIFLRQFNGQNYIQIIDNGMGMTKDVLINAMRIGSENPKEERNSNDLGRFGLGLKTASFSQCRLLSVVSKKDEKIYGLQWDLDLVSKSDRFEVIEMSEVSISTLPNIELLTNNSCGTIVQWEIFDRISDATKNLTDELSDMMNVTIEHISLIFHRYLANGLEIFINYEKVIPKDPFLSKHPATQELKEKIIKIDGKEIELQPFILPHYSRLSAEDKRMSGKTNEQYKSQGFYLYRNKRLIVWGDYLGLSRKTELAKNLRIQVDIPNSLDDIWEIDVKKSYASVPSKIKKNMISAISDGESASKKVNTYRGKKEIKKEISIWNFFEERNQGFYLEINKENSIYKEFVSGLDRKSYDLFLLFIKSLSANIPFQRIYAEISDGQEVSRDESDENINSLNSILSEMKKQNRFGYSEFLKSLLSLEPYASNDSAIKIINMELGNSDV